VNAITFAKGHGTGNDFVILPDLADRLELSPQVVAALCDRRTGIGGDGVLRVVGESDAFFMDYRNADGTVAEMCGNGIRVFARYLVAQGLHPPGSVDILTRAGIVAVDCPVDGDVAVQMGSADVPRLRAIPVVTVGERSWSATPVIVPNPHAVVFVDDLSEAGELREAPEVAPAVFPDGVNIEFVADRGPDHIAMRVFERGVGETRSCGTGACAAAWAARRRTGVPEPGSMRVDVPGGRLIVEESDSGGLTLIGPAVIVAEGTIDERWWADLSEGRSRVVE